MTRPSPRPQPSAGASPIGTRRRISTGTIATLAVLTVLTVALVVINVVLLSKRDDHSAVDDARTAAVASAKTRIPAMLSYDYQSLDTYAKQAPANATGKFAKSYGDFVKLVVLPSAKDQQISTKVSIKSIGVVQANSGDVVLLVLLDQATTNKTTKSPQLQGSRLRVTMHHTDGKWLVSDIGQT